MKEDIMLPFDFETAARVELKGTFIQQPEYVFLNISAKGYNKEEDVRYALSADECCLELRDKKAPVPTIQRLCVTLSQQVDVTRSEV